jgi:DnaJ-class molecular chaperone
MVHVQVEVPTSLTAKQRELIEELGRTAGHTELTVPQRKGLLDRMRSLLDE